MWVPTMQTPFLNTHGRVLGSPKGVRSVSSKTKYLWQSSIVVWRPQPPEWSWVYPLASLYSSTSVHSRSGSFSAHELWEYSACLQQGGLHRRKERQSWSTSQCLPRPWVAGGDPGGGGDGGGMGGGGGSGDGGGGGAAGGQAGHGGPAGSGGEGGEIGGCRKTNVCWVTVPTSNSSTDSTSAEHLDTPARYVMPSDPWWRSS